MKGIRNMISNRTEKLTTVGRAKPDVSSQLVIFDSATSSLNTTLATLENCTFCFSEDDKYESANLGDPCLLRGNNIQTTNIQVDIPDQGVPLGQINFSGTDTNGLVDISGTRHGFSTITSSTTLPLNFPSIIYLDATNNDLAVRLPTNTLLVGRTLILKRIDITDHRVWVIGPIEGKTCIHLRSKCHQRKEWGHLPKALHLQYANSQYYII